jgi:hypothetical protein
LHTEVPKKITSLRRLSGRKARKIERLWAFDETLITEGILSELGALMEKQHVADVIFPV